jgi:hypothetical protein
MKEEQPMAKSQKRSNREIRKPKAGKKEKLVSLSSTPESPVNSLMQKQKSKS